MSRHVRAIAEVAVVVCVVWAVGGAVAHRVSPVEVQRPNLLCDAIAEWYDRGDRAPVRIERDGARIEIRIDPTSSEVLVSIVTATGRRYRGLLRGTLERDLDCADQVSWNDGQAPSL